MKRLIASSAASSASVQPRHSSTNITRRRISSYFLPAVSRSSESQERKRLKDSSVSCQSFIARNGEIGRRSCDGEHYRAALGHKKAQKAQKTYQSILRLLCLFLASFLIYGDSQTIRALEE